jgi:hypothetical protein
VRGGSGGLGPDEDVAGSPCAAERGAAGEVGSSLGEGGILPGQLGLHEDYKMAEERSYAHMLVSMPSQCTRAVDMHSQTS